MKPKASFAQVLFTPSGLIFSSQDAHGAVKDFYPHMPISMLGIYRLLFVRVCPQDFL